MEMHKTRKGVCNDKKFLNQEEIQKVEINRRSKSDLKIIISSSRTAIVSNEKNDAREEISPIVLAMIEEIKCSNPKQKRSNDINETICRDCFTINNLKIVGNKQ
ncbi:hypothetical protein WUBG_02554 [Wuchereria bancrofti]|uniref:Uncharacterized protein n=1 Tax=Wuchereria bancrofti TaxID=6293 RepID=J9BGW9_WUCBA|nr:hypothetical protein WUBG_02554 [Wuchereria bancrofti]